MKREELLPMENGMIITLPEWLVYGTIGCLVGQLWWIALIIFMKIRAKYHKFDLTKLENHNTFNENSSKSS